ncbi:AAA family ATPase [Oryzobacter terrae]|uniref:helix-turn-helix transcriptional regulator n=1 Tax=Oryzobacter terrae TaxID=1620385 RepID=UPI00366CCE02
MMGPGPGPLVGREEELSVLRTMVAAATDGTAGALLLAGDAGVGKTRLVRALREVVVPPEALVLRAQCVDVGDPGLPHLVLTDLVRGVRARAAVDPAVAAALDRAPALADLTDLADPRADGGGTLDELRRLRTFDAATTLLAELGRLGGPVVVTVEDVQWVDASSADFLRFLVSRLTSERLLAVATVRTDGLSGHPRGRRLVGDLDRLPTVRRVEVEPFDATEVATYLSSAGVGAQDAAEVFRRTRGNAYFVATVAADLARGGTLGDGVPRALADLLLGRLERLPDPVRRIVRCAAITAQPVSDRMLRRVAGLEDDVLDEALRRAVGDGLLVPDGAGYAFPHDLLRAAVHDDLLPGERARMHAERADALVAGADGVAAPAEVAHHAVESGDPTRVLVWSVRAADEAMRVLAPVEALAHLERALETWPAVDRNLRRGQPGLEDLSEGLLAVRAARAAGLAGEPRRAVAWARTAVTLCDAEDDPAARVRARAELARRLVEVDDTEAAVRPAREAAELASAGGLDPRLAASAQVVLARSLVAARRPREARPEVDRALGAVRTAGDPGLEVEALTTAAFLDEIEGDRTAAAERLDTALRLARATGEAAAELRAHYSLASLHYYHGDVEASLPVLRTAMARVTESGVRWSEPGVELRLLLAVAAYVAGDLAGSLHAADAPESPPPDVAAARLAAVSCYAAVASGSPDAARRLAALREHWDDHPQVALVAGGCEADLLTWHGEPEQAVEVAARAQSHLDAAVGEGTYGGLWLSALALAALADEAESCRARRDDAGAADAVRRGEPLRRRVDLLVATGRGRPGDLGPEGHAWHARAVAEHARLTGAPAVEEWRRAVEAFGYGHVLERARCHWRLAGALVAHGDREGARTHAAAAAAEAERIGALPLQRAVAATVRRERLSSSASSGDGVLTAREREVLALVAEGLTNREVGSRLFISEKTASVHLSNLMAKLNVSSRTEAVTVAQRRGLLDVL